MKKLYLDLCEDYTHNFIPRKEIKANPKIEDLMNILNLDDFNSQAKLNPLLFFYFRFLFIGTFEKEFLNENANAEKILRTFEVEKFRLNQMGERMLLLLRTQFIPEIISDYDLYKAFSSPENWDSEIAMKAFDEYKKRKLSS